MRFHTGIIALISAAVLAFSVCIPFAAEAVQLSAPQISQENVYAASEDEAVLELRQALREHSPSVTVTFPDADYSKSEIGYQVMYSALEETGCGTDGDYLRFSIKSFKCSIYKNNGDVKLDYTIAYYTTPEEEAALTEKLGEIMEEQRFDSIIGDYNKIRSIYRYVTSTVVYSDDESDPYAYTAYNAVFNGNAVCQGVTQLMYRIFNDCGIKCRIIAGINRDLSGTRPDGNHVWLIVRLDGKYYFLDPTWDISFGGKSFYYFLKGQTDFDTSLPKLVHIATRENQKTFPDYQSEEFMSAYLIAETAYPTPVYSFGDVNGDKLVDAVDASLILAEYARLSCRSSSSFSQAQSDCADIDKNGTIDAVDASIVLAYYAKLSDGSYVILSDFLKNI